MLVLKTDKIDKAFTIKITKIFKEEGNLQDYEFEVGDPTIDLTVLTPHVKEVLGDSYCMSHLKALKMVQDKIA